MTPASLRSRTGRLCAGQLRDGQPCCWEATNHHCKHCPNPDTDCDHSGDLCGHHEALRQRERRYPLPEHHNCGGHIP